MIKQKSYKHILFMVVFVIYFTVMLSVYLDVIHRLLLTVQCVNVNQTQMQLSAER